MKHASERELWVAVILQATQDGLHDQQSRAWFQPINSDFVEVCNLAGLEPEAVAERAADAFHRADKAHASGARFEINRGLAAPARQPAARYEHDGKSLTLPEWSHLTGIKAGTIRDRMNNGRSFAEAIDPKFVRKPRCFNGRPIRKPKLYTVNGVSKSLSEWATEYSVSFHSLSQRLKRGMTLEHALAHSKQGNGKNLLHTVDGVSKTYGQWADHLGISYDAFLKRLRDGKGRTVAEAVAMGGPKGRGAVANLVSGEGTGGGSVAQERAEIEFSANPEKTSP
ncbi:hypothetical protein [Mesorhizobium sp. Root172]|uniref:hypothetical protein n=1 Tax=Mesorhizobium sp. Root172 TaxID=1736481 RepID=UPI000701647C|nr:hypothetical protein [Mesorhizobium sp. Root172]KRB31719.1 hypothetical protein ASE05_01300 [Mesorhizobium sp. Root172]